MKSALKVYIEFMILIFISFLISNVIFNFVNNATTEITSKDKIQQQAEQVKSTYSLSCYTVSNLLPYDRGLDYSYDVKVGWPYEYNYTKYSNYCNSFNENLTGQIEVGSKEYFINFGMVFALTTVTVAVFYKIVIIPFRRKHTSIHAFYKSKSPYTRVFILTITIYTAALLCFFGILDILKFSSFNKLLDLLIAVFLMSLVVSIAFVWGLTILRKIIRIISTVYRNVYVKNILSVVLASIFLSIISNIIIPRDKNLAEFLVEALFWVPFVTILLITVNWFSRGNR